MSKTVTVFGSSLPREYDEEYKIAYQLGKTLALNGFDICNGGNLGIMEAVSKGAVECGAKAIGVVVDLFLTQPNKYCSEVIRCKTLFERIETLIKNGDAYIILQGGTGTLLELASVWEFINKGIMEKKPIACHSLMWQKIVSLMEIQIIKENRTTDLVKTFIDIDECANFIINWNYC